MRATISARYALEIQPFVSTEQTRYYLQGFTIDRNPSGGVRIVATDGHRLACFHDATGALDRDGNEPLPIVKLDKPALATIKAALKTYARSGDDAVVLHLDGTTATLAIRDAAEGVAPLGTFYGILVDGTYPDYARVIPSGTDYNPGKGDLAASWCFNPDYIASFGTVSPNKPGSRSVELVRTGTAGSPHLVFVGDRPDFFGVIMPIRCSGHAEPPAWYSAPPAAPAAAAPAVAAEEPVPA